MPSFWHFAARMLRFRGQLAAALFFAALSAAGLGAGLVSLGPILRLLIDPSSGEGLRALAQEHNMGGSWPAIPESIVAALPEAPYDGVVLLMMALAVLTIFGATANFLHQFLSLTLCTRVVAAVRMEIFRHAVHLPLSLVVRRGPAEFTSRVLRDSSELQQGLVALTSRAVAQITKGLAAFAAALWFDWRLTAVALVVAPVIAVVLRKFGKRIRRATRGALEAQETLLRVTSESMQGLRAVKSGTAESDAVHRFDRANREVVKEELRVRTARAASGPVVELLAVIIVIGLALVAAKQIVGGHILIDDFVMTLGALAVAAGSFRPLAGLVNDIQAASAPSDRLLEVLREAREDEPDRHGVRRPALARHSRDIRFESVTFGYPGQERPALDAVDLTIRFGERVAIVGPNGCGKTTLLALLPRLLVPQQGRVLIDGVELGEVSLRSLRQQMGVVTQETVLFRGTIAENIRFGNFGATHEQVIDAARRAHAAEFIERLPDVYDSSVSEQGASLSGGQRQRLAIARAILRDPTILILDEATSQIDAESEAQIGEAIAEFGRGRTVILIAHRLSTILGADRIVMMDSGRVVDVGPHEELLRRCEGYRRLFRGQFAASDEPAAIGR
ncbi:MAG: ABC transporter ATP-binding protein [Phycisphaeraceae bacterium]|nr:ABC transporter ATP-binding protein [Phycisphaeraceae bacterium]